MNALYLWFALMFSHLIIYCLFDCDVEKTADRMIFQSLAIAGTWYVLTH